MVIVDPLKASYEKEDILCQRTPAVPPVENVELFSEVCVMEIK